MTADVLGYEQERRALAKRLGVDPYTTNHVLSEKMNDLAWVAFSGRVGLNTVGAVVVPFSMAISATSISIRHGLGFEADAERALGEGSTHRLGACERRPYASL